MDTHHLRCVCVCVEIHEVGVELHEVGVVHTLHALTSVSCSVFPGRGFAS